MRISERIDRFYDAAGIELKVRHVRDPSKWGGLPVGTPIVPGMMDRGKMKDAVRKVETYYKPDLPRLTGEEPKLRRVFKGKRVENRLSRQLPVEKRKEAPKPKVAEAIVKDIEGNPFDIGDRIIDSQNRVVVIKAITKDGKVFGQVEAETTRAAGGVQEIDSRNARKIIAGPDMKMTPEVQKALKSFSPYDRDRIQSRDKNATPFDFALNNGKAAMFHQQGRFRIGITKYRWEVQHRGPDGWGIVADGTVGGDIHRSAFDALSWVNKHKNRDPRDFQRTSDETEVAKEMLESGFVPKVTPGLKKKPTSNHPETPKAMNSTLPTTEISNQKRGKSLQEILNGLEAKIDGAIVSRAEVKAFADEFKANIRVEGTAKAQAVDHYHRTMATGAVTLRGFQQFRRTIGE